jgi:hypothetical protein
MDSHASPKRLDSLLTATAVAGPVLIRLSNSAAHNFLLAEDVSYDHAGKILLQQVRAIRRSRHLRLAPQALGIASYSSLMLMKSEFYVATAFRPCIRVALHPTHYAFIQLLPEQYQFLRAMTPRRLAATALVLAPLPARSRLRDRVVFSVRMAASRLGHLVRASQRVLNTPLLPRP